MAAPPFPTLVFAHPLESTGGSLLTATIALTTVAALVVIARIYVRAVMIHSFGADDCIMVFAMLCSATVLGLLVAEVNHGLGLHITNPKLLANFTDLLRLQFFEGWIIVVGISSAKISVGFFLLRLVQGKWYKRTLYSWICFLIVFTMASVLTIVFRCIPVQAFWDIELEMDPNTKCFSFRAFRNAGLANGSINIITDFVFAFLPIPLVIPLQINTRTKIILICILSLGYFACVSAIVKEALLAKFFNNPDPFFDNSFTVWNDAELNIGIIAACLPTLRPLFSWIFVTAKTMNASVHFPTSRRRYVRTTDEEDIKLSSALSHSNTLSSTGKDGYHISVVGGQDKGPIALHKPSRRISLSLGSRTRSKTGRTTVEQESGERDLELGARVSTEERRSGQTDTQWPASGLGGIMRTTEVVVSR